MGGSEAVAQGEQRVQKAQGAKLMEHQWIREHQESPSGLCETRSSPKVRASRTWAIR